MAVDKDLIDVRKANDEQLDIVRRAFLRAAVTVGQSEAWWRAYFRAYPDKLAELAKINLLPPQEQKEGGGNQIIFVGAIPHSVLDDKVLPGEYTEVERK